MAEPWGGTPPLCNPFLLLCVVLPHVHSGACSQQGLSGQTVLLKTIPPPLLMSAVLCMYRAWLVRTALGSRQAMSTWVQGEGSE